jgi:hypothetical protein
MPAKLKSALVVLKSFLISYVDRDGAEKEQEIKSHGPYGTMTFHPGGSVYLGTMDLVLSVAGCVTLLRGVILRIRASDGALVAETKDSQRAESRIVDNAEVRGNLCWELIGDESRIIVAAAAVAAIPALATRVKTAQKELARRAA